MKRLLPLLFVIGFPLLVVAQQSAITGTVLSGNNGEPLAGATVRTQTQSTVTDLSGNFALRLTAAADSLTISFIGYRTQTIQLNHSPGFRHVIQLEPTANRLNEVVINTGYQRLPRERATGSFAQVDRQLLNRRVSTDLLSRLEDVTSGLIFNRGATSTNAQTPITIRGQSTINANVDPLIILDNFPYQGDLNDINPNDVESVTVLKDAAAASIWGARAGNGVIVITTKKGAFNRPIQVSLNANVTIGAKPDLFYQPQMSSAEFIDIEQKLFAQGFYQAAEQSAAHTALTPAVELFIAQRDGKISTAEANAQLEVLKQQDVRNDLNRYFYRKSVNQQYAFNLSGGSEKQRFYVSTGYDKDLANLNRNTYDRFTLNASNTYSLIGSRLQVNTGFMLTQSRTQLDNPNYNASYNAITNTPYYPYARLADSEGNPLTVANDYRMAYARSAAAAGLLDWQYSPVNELYAADQISRVTDYRINASADYKIIPALHALVSYQYGRGLTDGRNLQSQDSYYTGNLINQFSQVNADGSIKRIIPLGGILDLGQTSLTSHNIRGQLNFSKGWQKNEINAIAGYELQEVHTTGNTYRLYGYDGDHATSQLVDYVNPYPLYQNPGATGQVPNRDTQTELTDRYISWYANAGYTLDRRYSLTGSVRFDRSNLFGVNTNQKGIPLWSAGAGWNISHESFYHLGWLPYLKFRATYGLSGNVDKKLSAFTTAQYALTKAPTTLLPFQRIVNPPNPELRWEQIRTTNFGLDFSTRNDRISGTIEVYQKKGIDLIGTTPFAPSTGISSFTGNNANTLTHGADLTINTRIIDRTIQWNTTLLLSYVKDRVTEYATAQLNASTIGLIGYPIQGNPLYAIYSYPWAGLDPLTGDPQGILNGQVSKDYAAILSNASAGTIVYNGSARPTTFGAFRNTITYRNFSLSANISFRLGYYFRRSSVNYTSVLSGLGGSGDYALRWQQPGDESHTQIPSLPAAIDNNRDGFYALAETLVGKADHIRLQDINFSYDLSGIRLKKLAIRHLQLYLYANNLALLWKANSFGVDPDYQTGPPPKTIAAGFKLDF
ncbi:SusC/RagA family TonB-linked outer membrane protein [Mucilaginibacter koreensis]